jgi:hypothetical protein
MANQEHVRILKQGADTWNEWRQAHPEIQPNLRRARLSGANLSLAVLVRTCLTNTTLKGCRIYGISVWDCNLDGAEQLNVNITPEEQPTITVDNLKVAQFIYLLLNNAEIRRVIDTITSKVVLILGRFSPERKAVLDALRKDLRKHDYLPVLFDFREARQPRPDRDSEYPGALGPLHYR